MVEQADKSFLFTQAAEMSGDECSSAERMRRMRARRKEASHDEYDSDENLSHNDNNSSQSNGMSQCDSSPSKRYHIQNQNNNRSRAKSRIDLDLELELKQKTETEEADSDFVSAELAASAAADAAAPPAGDLFSLEKLLDIRSKNDINLSGDGVMAFLTEMTASGWMLYKKPVTKAGIVKALRGWAKYHEDYHLGDDVKLEKKIVKVLKELLGNDKAEEFLNCDDIDYQLALLKDCPVEAFTDEMLEYMTEEWGIPFDSSGDET